MALLVARKQLHGVARLTRTERALVRAILDGQTNREIASRRRTSVFTVANQVSRLYAKVRVRDRAGLAARYARRLLPASARWFWRNVMFGSLEVVSCRSVRDGICIETRKRKSKKILSPRETHVMAMYTEGVSQKEIARDLGVSLSAVGTYVRRALVKLNLGDHSELVVLLATEQILYRA